MYWPETVKQWRMNEHSTNLVALPLFHIGALSWFTASFLVGAPTVVLRRADPEAILDAIEAHGVTHINVVPTVLQAMMQAQRARPRNVSSFRVVTCGGGPVPEAYLRDAHAVFGCLVIAFYGLSEAGGGVSHSPQVVCFQGCLSIFLMAQFP